MSGPGAGSVSQGNIISPINLYIQIEEAKSPSEAKKTGESSGIRSIVQMARALEAQPPRPPEPPPAKGFWRSVLSAICSVGRSIKNFVCGPAKVQPPPEPKVAVADELRCRWVSPEVHASNTRLVVKLLGDDELPEELQQEISRAFDEVRQNAHAFTPELKGTTLKENPQFFSTFYEMVRKSPNDIAAVKPGKGGGIADMIKHAVNVETRRNAVKQFISEGLAKIGHASPRSLESLRSEFLKFYPHVRTTMLNLGATLEPLMTSQQTFQECFDKFAEFTKKKDELMASAMESAVAELSRTSDFTPDQVKAKIDFTELEADMEAKLSLLSPVSPDTIAEATFSSPGEKALPPVPNFEEAPEWLEMSVDRFIEKTREFFNSTETQGFSNQLATFFKNEVFENPYIPNTNVFVDCSNAASMIEVAPRRELSNLFVEDDESARLEEGAKRPSVEATFEKLQNYAREIERVMTSTYDSDDLSHMSMETKTTIRSYITLCDLDYNEDLGDALRKNSEFLSGDVANYIKDLLQTDPPPAFAKECLQIIALANPEITSIENIVTTVRDVNSLSISHMSALVCMKDAIDELFPLLDLDSAELDGIVSKMLASTDGPLTVKEFGNAAFKAMFQDVVKNKLLPEEIDSAVEDADLTNYTQEEATDVINTLFSRFPELDEVPDLGSKEAYSAGVEKLKATLARMKGEVEKVVTYRHEISTTADEQRERIFTALAENLGLTLDFVQQNLDLETNPFEKKVNTLSDMINDPHQALESLPSPKKEITENADDYIARKTDLYRNVDQMQLSDAGKTYLKNFILSTKELKRPDLPRVLEQLANAMNARLLITAIQDPDLSPEDLLDIFNAFALQYDEVTRPVFVGSGDYDVSESKIVSDLLVETIILKHDALSHLSPNESMRLQAIQNTADEIAGEKFYNFEGDEPTAEEKRDQTVANTTALLISMLLNHSPVAAS